MKKNDPKTTTTTTTETPAEPKKSRFEIVDGLDKVRGGLLLMQGCVNTGGANFGNHGGSNDGGL